LTIKTKNVNILVCPECWEADHPQLKIGMYPINDPQAVRNPRPDTNYPESRSYTEVIYNGAGMALSAGTLANSVPTPSAISYFSGGFFTGGMFSGGFFNTTSAYTPPSISTGYFSGGMFSGGMFASKYF
jgi:hypothetical protein